MQIIPTMIVLDYETHEFILQANKPESIKTGHVMTLEGQGLPLGEVCQFYKIKCVQDIPDTSDIKVYIEKLTKKKLVRYAGYN